MFLCVREEGKSLVCVVLCDVVRLRVDNFWEAQIIEDIFRDVSSYSEYIYIYVFDIISVWTSNV